ncbi:MAG: hypothetical protein NC038_06135 [Paludibacter sp.]|nr:hypothetical protein [Bacteroidales bacterium]MCM1069470.1 hypothetical protein [Prevotella sp.]MCM1354126.1 hypothetical protein [Bacteroides sp.]MCM1443017.1 hypothetical protein [Muribaculum sp.]MCM1482201.1 hypothetical protein [Paludibacter sp.]
MNSFKYVYFKCVNSDDYMRLDDLGFHSLKYEYPGIYEYLVNGKYTSFRLRTETICRNAFYDKHGNIIVRYSQRS